MNNLSKLFYLMLVVIVALFIFIFLVSSAFRSEEPLFGAILSLLLLIAIIAIINKLSKKL